MVDKLKVLMCSEASFLSSGFGTYTKELLTRLYKTKKYKIAEFASYAFVNDPRDVSIPWRYYANAVRENDPRHKEYSSRTDNQFGRWRFEKILFDFKPDVVIDIRDYWMSYYQSISPLRNFFHWILMPTVDSEPQQEQWIDTFISADAIFTYSDWGADVLLKQSNNKINYIDTVSPGVDLNIFNIKSNPEQIKQNFGLPKDSIIIGSVMRNQKRKLIPELFFAFRELLDSLERNNNDIGKKIYLYLHTSYPDAGWDIPELLKQTRLANRVFFTYTCPSCEHILSSTFSHPFRTCPSCGTYGLRFPSVTHGISQEALANIYNMFDLYVQYAICEGFGMPQVEAAACGVPIITVNYSAMCDIVKKLGAYSVEPKTYFKELETKAIRTYPDNKQLINHILSHIQLSKTEKQNKRQTTRALAEQYYNWDDIALKWEKYLDTLSDSGFRANWDNPPKYLELVQDIENIQRKDFFNQIVNTCVKNLQDPSKIGSSMILDMAKDADYSFTQAGISFQPFSYGDIHDNLQSLVNNNNQTESLRTSNVKFNDDFIQYAHLKDKDE